MFGYVRPAVDSLLVREARAYRAFYCGVCRRLGKQCGPACRAFLQYDFALLAIILDGLANKPGSIDNARCAVNPLRKLQSASGPAVDYAADAHGILLLGKAMDDKADGRLSAELYLWPLRAITRKARDRNKDLATAMEFMLLKQQEAERQRAGIDDAALPFAQFMQEMFAPELIAGPYTEAMKWLGSHLGRWIYLADALDDYDKDVKKGSYNPLHTLGNREAAARTALPLMNHYAEQAVLALNVLPDSRHISIARNVFESGLYQAAEAIAAGELRIDRQDFY